MVASFEAKSTVVVKYEDALAHPEKTCDGVAAEYGASRLRAEFLVPRRTMLRASDDRFESLADATSEQVFDREYYEQGRYMDRYSPSNIEAVNKLLVDDIVGPLGYVKVM
jgi:hypothetical protein